MNELEQILVRLSEAFGPSGFESEIRKLVEEMIQDVTEVEYDHLGSIIATHQGMSKEPKILLAAHLDEVGLLVRGILPGGELKVVPLGGWWAPALLAQPVIIRARTGDHFGVIGAKSPHFLRDEEKNRQLKLEDLVIDVGVSSREQVLAMGIEPGNPVAPAVKTIKMTAEGIFSGKAFDDRVGCAAMIKILRDLVGHQHPNLVIGAGTVQEENGLKGAKSVASKIQPDLCIVLEGTPADDFPGGVIVQGKLGSGPQIRRFDPTMISNQALVNLVIDQAKDLRIPYQVAVRESGGTDAGAIQVQTDGGAPVIVIGVPVRYAHSHYGIINIRDIEATVQLVKALIQRLDQTTVDKLKKHPW